MPWLHRLAPRRSPHFEWLRFVFEYQLVIFGAR
jgi:hypothetical protein